MQLPPNSSGDYAIETLDALEAIGALKTKVLLKKAIDCFPSPNLPKDRDMRNEIFDNLDEKAINKMSVLDDKFYEYEDDIMELSINYIKKNLDQFEF